MGAQKKWRAVLSFEPVSHITDQAPNDPKAEGPSVCGGLSESALTCKSQVRGAGCISNFTLQIIFFFVIKTALH